MVSKYFELKTSRADFKQNTSNLIESLKDKKVIIYDAGAGFTKFELEYGLTENLNIVGIADKNFSKTNQTEFNGLKAIKVTQIVKEDFDYILVTNEQSKAIKLFLNMELGIDAKKIKTIFNENIKDEAENTKFLFENNFDKTLPKLLKKLKNKKIIFYGAGSFLELIKEYFDISGLNVLGVSDKKYAKPDSEPEFLGYKTIPPEKIKELKPDYVLVSTKFYVKIVEDLYDNLLKRSGIKLKPLVKKSFRSILDEIKCI